MQPFKISISSQNIVDLNLRLDQTRWPDEIINSGWEYGTNLSSIKSLCQYWQHSFSWLKQESMLNQFHHYKTEIDELGLHFIHEKGRGKRNLPIMLIHGWPDSFYRFVKLIPILTAPDENGLAFDVIVPSIPGFGFSDRPVKAGMDREKIADLFSKLMTQKLGYKKYFVQGGDWGGSITQEMGLKFGDSITSIHLSSIPSPIIFSSNPDELTTEEKKSYDSNKQWQQTEGTFTLLQSTKPQTLSYELNDSPSGLAGWYLEKFKNWSDNERRPGSITKDDLLTNLSIYWFTQTAGSAERLYYEGAIEKPVMSGQVVQVPTHIAIFPNDILQMPESFARRYFNVKDWQPMAAGGHFAALEVPDLMAASIRQSFAGYANK